MTTELINTTTARPGEIRPVDEFANFVTHGLGLVLSVIGSLVLMSQVPRDDLHVVIASAIYCASLVALYAASTLSHSFHDIGWRRFFRTLDQACIYLLIAGSFTPVAAIFLTNGWWPMVDILMWVLAFLGVGLVMRLRHLSASAQLTYLVLGWLPLISYQPIVAAAPREFLAWVIAGGVFYTTGTLILHNDHRARYVHALWHAFVIAGSICHYIAILMLVQRA